VEAPITPSYTMITILPLILENATLSDYGTFFGGIAALLTAFGVAFVWLLKNILRRQTQSLEKTLESTYQRGVVRLMESNTRKFSHVPADKTYSFDVIAPNGHKFFYPLYYMQWIEYMPGLHLQLTSNSATESEVLLIATIDAHLPLHAHDEVEEVRVERGMMMDSQTQKVYFPGDTWVIEAGQMHSSWFAKNTRCSITLRPPLPTADQRPIMTTGVEEMF
jgi:hypothetical protein